MYSDEELPYNYEAISDYNEVNDLAILACDISDDECYNMTTDCFWPRIQNATAKVMLINTALSNDEALKV